MRGPSSPPRLARPAPLAALVVGVLVACGGGASELTASGTTSSGSGSTSTGEPAGDGDASQPLPTTDAASTGPGSSGSAEATTPEEDTPPFCGDGEVDPGEQCDHGEALNDDHAYCTDACRYNICGDGLVHAGHEACDNGAANSDEHGSRCTATCEPGTWCGDNVVQAPHEECDLGPGNGGGGVDGQGIGCDPLCQQEARRIFVTRQVFDGQLGGLGGADELCRELAADAGLAEPERFMALLSDAGISLDARYGDLLSGDLPYVYVTGKKVADSYTTLLKLGPGDPGLHLDEYGEALLGVWVASDTDPDGSIYQEIDGMGGLVVTDCAGWSSDGDRSMARVGFNAKSADEPDYLGWKQNGGWLSSATVLCDEPMHLYCIEL